MATSTPFVRSLAAARASATPPVLPSDVRWMRHTANAFLVLAVLPSHFERDAKGGITIQWHQLQNLATVLKPVGDIVKALPKSLLERLG